MPHEHAHDHGHHHHHDHHASLDAQTLQSRAFGWGIGLNLGFVMIEAGFGFYANSLSLLADAGHNLSDVLGLALAWWAIVLARKPPSRAFSYGFGGSTILAALTNSVLLLVAMGAMLWEAGHRLWLPVAVDAPVMSWVALVGVVVNTGTAMLLLKGSHGDLNQRAAFLHMVADAALSLGVVVAGVAIIWTQWLWLDAAISILIALVIIVGAWQLLRQSLSLALQAVPKEIDADKVHDFLSQQAGVQAVHDLHIWAMSTRNNALTVHLVMPDGHPGDAFLQHLMHELEADFHIAHSTIQIELGNTAQGCALADEGVV
jgi:cobalt-zinc-cadmium efflux system protein